MTIITRGVPVIMQPGGVVELTEHEASTELMLDWEQQLDRGDAVLMRLEERSPAGCTHRFISSSGGWFHVEIDEGNRIWPELSLPPGLSMVSQFADEVNRLVSRIQCLQLATEILEDRVRELKNGEFDEDN